MPPAVAVRRAVKRYGRDTEPVLRHLDMTVDTGNIYGLLGPSGCGKTTLLSCIVGRRRLDAGDMWVLGFKPNENRVPGHKLGYMPQDIALVGEFTVRDAVFYFGRIYAMRSQKLKERFEFLSDLLDLPPGGKLVKCLSGGQQRRVSLAAALVHEPELLILDEPTVGLDPVLRESDLLLVAGPKFPLKIPTLVQYGVETVDKRHQLFGNNVWDRRLNVLSEAWSRIWEFLAELARGGSTVIITTHYIDETKQAHKIGLLRNGQILAEESPEEILRKFDCDTLEEAFFKLSMRQHQMPPVRHSLSASPDVIPEGAGGDHSRYSSKDQFDICTSSTDVLTKKESVKENKNLCRARYRAVFIKSMQQFGRHPGGLIFSLLFPIIQAVAFFAAVGHDPRDLRVAVVNDEIALSPYGLEACTNKTLQHVRLLEDEVCDFYMLSCWFLETLEENKLYQVPYPNVEDAITAVRTGALYGAIHIPYNYSSATSTRIRVGEDIDDDILRESNVAVYLDMTNHQISYFMKSQLYKTYEQYTKKVMRACQRPENMIQVMTILVRVLYLYYTILAILPVRFEGPIYGSAQPHYVVYMAPGIMITIIFFLSAIVTSTLLISDRLEGVWERSVVAGVRAHELLNVHIAIQSAVILFQTMEMMCLAFLAYDLPHQGPLLAVGLLLFLQGLSGMCYGFLLSVCCSSYTLAFFIATGSFYPMILLCGILWPLEGMSKGLRILALTLPFTMPTRALRNILEKGATVTDPTVYQGILVTTTWLTVTILLCYVVLRLKARYR